MNGEKWAIYAILLLVLLIASFNMIGALSLLVLEKQKDMAILKAMGAEGITIKSIFITEGLLWSFMGGAIGLVAGTLICLGQQQFEWVELQGSFMIEAYPISIHFQDYLLIICTILVVGIAASWYPAARAVKIDMPSLKTD
jgi:lipoprotein-releasing system permease protein